MFLVCDQRSSVGLCTYDYKLLCVATLVNTQTHRQHTDRQLLTGYTVTSASQLS